jgi:5-methylcytosine-specific restriction enzyme B
MTNLDPHIDQDLRRIHDDLARNGKLFSPEKLQAAYTTFRDRFGPENLSSLDGTALLHAMHLHGNKESLVYWLEFKDDDEFPGISFGSIAGGSAHKFGLFRRKETGQWVTGPAQAEIALTEAEAVVIARKHRDQLLAGVELIEKLETNADDNAYLRLQQALDKTSPNVSGLAWGHKYFSVLFPNKLDDYQNHRWQRFHLLKVLQLPPETEGLYVCGGRFVKLAAQMGWPMQHLTATLNVRNGRPTKYWRIGTSLGGKDSIWDDMLKGGYIAIGWGGLGDLSQAGKGAELKAALCKLLEEYYPGDQKTSSRKAGEIRNFVSEIKDEENEVVVAAEGGKILGIGRVVGPYRYDETPPIGAPHRRAVEWISTEQWKLPVPEGLRTTVFAFKKDEHNILEIERRLLYPPTKQVPGPIVNTRGDNPRTRRLVGIPGRLQAILERKGQAILYGPPGTGKTYWARETAFDLAAFRAFGKAFSELTKEEKGEVIGEGSTAGLVRSCTFHPNYGYEDFLEGFRPASNNLDQLIFNPKDGIFKRICADAQKKPDLRFILLIDEINRGDIPRIFGELLTLLESDKRGLTVNLPVSGDAFAIPANVYVIGTMNTADRSIALLDTALRRRFGFIELMPDMTVFGGASIDGRIPLGPWLSALNDRIREQLGRDGRNLQIGHAYLLEERKPVTDLSRFVRILSEDIIPLIEEYCYEDYETLSKIVGAKLVDVQKQRVREELFVPTRWDELVQALLEPTPELSTGTEAAVAVSVQEEAEDGEPEDEGK